MAELCKKVAKKGIEVIVTNEYMTKEELINWCSQNTLNCFLYNRNQPGLSATTDQAISSGRPLAISNNPTFRHIHPYIKPYPYQSLKESINHSQSQVLKIQNDWHPLNFARQFEKVLNDNQFIVNQDIDTKNKLIQLQSIQYRQSTVVFHWLIAKIKGKTKKILKDLGFKDKNTGFEDKNINFIPVSSSILETPPFAEVNNKFIDKITAENTILIVSHNQQSCGIYQYGINITRALQKSSRYSFIHVECSNEQELEECVISNNPSVVIYNYYPQTMPWLNSQITKKYKFVQMGIMHEVTQEGSDNATSEMFDYHLCPDPTLIVNNSNVVKVPRLIPPYINSTTLPNIITIGSFGFGFYDKGFEKLIETVQSEFDEARIVLHIPFNEVVDIEGSYHALNTAQRCRDIVAKPGIELIINHSFLELHQLLDFLASNTLNAFFYDVNKDRGISSCIEHALAVQRPIAITKCGMFRHVFNIKPSICIEDLSLTEIIKNGISPLVPFYNEWSEDNFILKYENIIDSLILLQDKKL